MKKTGFIIAVFLSLALVSSGQETFKLPVRAVSDSFISLHISVKGTPGTVIASGSSKGYIEAELEIPCSAGEKKTLEYYYHITRAGEWAGRGKGSVEMLFDTEAFPERLLVVSQKEKDVSSHRLFLFSLNKRFFKGGEKGYLIIQSADAVTTSLPSDKFNLTLKDVFPFSPDSPDIELQTVREQEGLYSFNIPVIPNSVYRLKIVDAANNGEAPLGDFLIGLRTFDPNISIFTDRNRTVFLQGEKVEVNLYLAGSGQFEGKINLAVDGKILTEQAVSFSKEKTVSFLLDTSDFSHGTHILKATLSNNAEATYPMEIVSSVLASHLVRLDYHFFASLLQPVSNGLSPAAIAQQAGLYVDAVTEGGSSYEIGDILFDKRENIFSKEDRYRDIKGFIEEHPLYLPKERTYNPIKTYHLLEEILKNRASYFLRPSFIRYLAHSIPEDENRRYRHVQLLAQTFRNYPSFAGLNYHDDTYALGYGETGWMDGRRAERMKALKQDFEKETGKKPEQDRKGWIDFINRLFPSVYERYQKGLKEVDKNYLGTSQLVPDAGAADGFYIPLVYRNLDAVTYLSYSDHVGFPLQEAFQGALYKAGLRDKPVYSTQNGHMPTSLRFEAMMQASTLCEGMGFMDINGKLGPYAIKDNWVLGNGGDHYRIPDGMRIAGRTVAELYKRYGDFFLKLNRGEQTAILFSYTQAASERTGSATDHKYTVFEAYSSLARSHIPADIITEEEISSGGFERYKVIVLAGLKVELPERVKTRLKEFQKQGGVIFADSECSFQVNSVKTLPVAFSSYGIHWGGFDGNLEYRLFYDVAVKKSPAIREAIGPFIEEMFTCENPRVFLFHRKAGSSHYLFTFHDTPPAFDWGLPFDADAEEIWKDSKLRNEYRAYSNKYSGSDRLYQNWMIPTVKEIRLKGLEGYTVYDVLEGKKIDVKDSVLNADFRRFEGRIYAFLPDEIAGVNLSVSGSLDCGVNLTGKSGKEIEEPVPVEVTITDREDNVVYHIFRASPFSERLPVQKTGTYTIKAKELFSGYFATGTFSVREDLEAKAQEVSDVVVFDRDALNRFVQQKRKAVIYVGEEQHIPIAEKIKASFPGQAVIRKISSTPVKDIPLKWKYDDEEISLKGELAEGKIIGRRQFLRDVKVGYPDPDPVFIIEDNVILLGTPGQNLLMEEIFNSSLAVRTGSENYPGKGRGMVSYVWSPFYAHCDSILLFGSDEEGLGKAVRTFADICNKGQDGTDIPAPPRLFQAGHQFTPAVQLSAVLKGKTEKGKDTASFIDEFSPGYTDGYISSLGCSDDGKTILAGTDAFGYNLFCLDEEGNILWKNKVRDYMIQGVGVSGGLTAAGIIHSDRRSAESSVFVYDRQGKFLWKESGFIRNALDQFVLLPEGRGVVVNKGDCLLALDKEHKQIWRYSPQLSEKEELRRLVISPDGKHILAGSWIIGNVGRGAFAHTLFLIDAFTGEELWKKKGGTDTVAFGADISHSSSVVTGSYEGSISVFGVDGKKSFYKQLIPEVKPEEILKEFSLNGIYQLRVSESGRYILVKRGAFDFNAYIINTVTGGIILLQAEGLIAGIDIYRDDMFAVGSFDRTVRVFDKSGRLLWKVDIGSAAELKFMPDGRLLAGTITGVLHCFGSDGKQMWKTDLGEAGYMPELNEFLAGQPDVLLNR